MEQSSFLSWQRALGECEALQDRVGVVVIASGEGSESFDDLQRRFQYPSYITSSTEKHDTCWGHLCTAKREEVMRRDVTSHMTKYGKFPVIHTVDTTRTWITYLTSGSDVLVRPDGHIACVLSRNDTEIQRVKALTYCVLGSDHDSLKTAC
jgi:hypothetical protein